MDKNQQSLSKGVYLELGDLREEIRRFADTLQLYENGTEVPNAEETIETLRGISLGAFSCAELLTMALKKSRQDRRIVSLQRRTCQDQIKGKVDEILQCCSNLSRSLRGLKQILRATPAAKLDGMEQASQRVQAALSNIAAEWEDL